MLKPQQWVAARVPFTTVLQWEQADHCPALLLTKPLNSGSICRAQSKVFLELWIGKCRSVSCPGILVLGKVSTDEVHLYHIPSTSWFW